MKISDKKEKGYPSPVAKGLLIGFSILLAICLIPAIINLSINQTLFKTDFYTSVLKKSNFYDQVPVLIGDTFISSGTASLKSGILAGMDQEQFKWLMTSLLPPGWIETETNNAMTSALDFMNFKTDSLSIVVDLQPVKDYLSSSVGKQSLVNFLENLPDCTDDQLTQIMNAMLSGQGGFAFCHPPSSNLFNMDTMLDPVINSFSNSLPAVVLIPSDNQPGAMDALTQSPVFQVYRIVRSVLSVFPWICLDLALIISLLSFRSPHWMFGSLGTSLVSAGLVTSIPGVWLFLSGARDFSGLFTNASLGSFQALEGVIIQVFQEGLQTAGQGLLIWCLSVVTLGLVLLVIWIITKR
jgi:hypothetical protein